MDDLWLIANNKILFINYMIIMTMLVFNIDTSKFCFCGPNSTV